MLRRRLPNLNALRAFEAAARHLSFSKAAEELCVTQGAVSRHIKALEASLDTPLFNRLTRAVELTEAGRKYFAVTHDAFDRIAQVTAQTRRRSREILTINVSPSFAHQWLMPRLMGFNDACPDIELQLVSSLAPIDFSQGDVDIGIRAGVPFGHGRRRDETGNESAMAEDWRDIVAELLAPEEFVPVCSAAFIQRNGPFLSPSDIATQPLIHVQRRPRAWEDWFCAQSVEVVGPIPGATYGHFFMALRAAVEGYGVALIPRLLAQSELASGHLVLAMNRTVAGDNDYYVLCRKQQLGIRKIAAFRAWLMAQFNDEQRQRTPVSLKRAAGQARMYA